MAVTGRRVEPCPRRIRGFVGGELAFDTTDARYVWERPHYPRYYIPEGDVRAPHLRTSAEVPDEPDLRGLVSFPWDAVDAWFEEDEEVFVHARNPYTRVDALRSGRHLRVEARGVTLADTRSPVLVFETGLPTRYYVPRTDVRFEHLRPSDAVSSCPYKGTTSSFWTVVLDDGELPDVAWSYDFPTRQLLSIANLVAFYNEEVDLVLDGRPLAREEAPASSRETEKRS